MLLRILRLSLLVFFLGWLAFLWLDAPTSPYGRMLYLGTDSLPGDLGRALDMAGAGRPGRAFYYLWPLQWLWLSLGGGVVLALVLPRHLGDRLMRRVRGSRTP
jgi:hypothetical protein